MKTIFYEDIILNNILRKERIIFSIKISKIKNNDIKKQLAAKWAYIKKVMRENV